MVAFLNFKRMRCCSHFLAKFFKNTVHTTMKALKVFHLLSVGWGMVRLMNICFLSLVVILPGCVINGDESKDVVIKNDGLSTSDIISTASELPTFKETKNQVDIGSSAGDIDSSWILGAIVNIKTGEVRGNDSYLIGSPVITQSNDVVFKRFVDGSLVSNTEWLSFIKGGVKKSVKVEVLVVKSIKVTTSTKGIDKDKLVKDFKKIPKEKRGDYYLINGYVDYIISANIFKHVGSDGEVGGVGAKIDGAWYNRDDNSTVYHKIMATYTPLPFAVDLINEDQVKDLNKETTEAIENNKIKIGSVEAPIVPL